MDDLEGQLERATGDPLPPQTATRLVTLGVAGVARRLIRVRNDGDTSILLAGDRGPMRPGLQRLLRTPGHEDAAWMLPWLLGRWPRGRVLVAIPVRAPDALTLGLIAPIAPTRMALSQSPLPFPRPSVQHFKAVTAASEAPGLVGCRLELARGSAAGIAGRWPIAPSRLGPFLTAWGVDPDTVDLARTVFEGLAEGLPKAPGVVVEGRYRPEVDPAPTVEIGPTGTGRALGLAAHLAGDAGQLEATARRLKARLTYRVRLTLTPEGPPELTLVLALPSDEARGRW